MWLKKYFFICILCNIIFVVDFSIFQREAEAKQFSIKILTAPWDKYTAADGSGLYFDILNEVYGREHFTFQLVPWKRAQVSFAGGEGDMLLGESGGVENCQYPKWPLDADFFSAFHLKSKIPQIPGSKDFNNYKVIWVRGYNIQNFVPGLKAMTEVDDLEQGIKMILGGRADILIDYDEDLKDYRTQKKLSVLENLISPTDISGGFIYSCFRKDKKNEPLVVQFDQQMNHLQKSGKMKALFQKYDRIKNYNKILEFPRK